MKVLFRVSERAPPTPLKPGQESFVVEEVLRDRNEEGEDQEYLVRRNATWVKVIDFDDYGKIESSWKQKVMKEHAKIRGKSAGSVSFLIYVHE